MPGHSGPKTLLRLVARKRSAVDPERQTFFLLLAGTILLPLQIWPPMPLAGMQISDVFFASAFVHFLWVHFKAPPAIASVPIAAFAAGAAVSALFGGSLIKLLGHFELAALGWMAACAPPNYARWLRCGLVVAAGFAALTAMAGLAVFFLGFAGYDPAGIPDNPLLYIHGSLVTDNYPRPRGTLVTGALLTSVVATGFALLWYEPALLPGRWRKRLIYLAFATALFFAFSRSIATFAVVLVTAELWRRNGPLWARAAWISVLAVYAIALWVSLRYHVVLDPLKPLTVDFLAEDGDRFGRWRLALAAILEEPIFGAGPGAMVADGWSAHNTWLNIWAVLGIVPLAAFAFLVFGSLGSARNSLSLGVACALSFHLIESIYNDIEDMRHIWLLIGLALGTGMDGQRSPKAMDT